MIIFRVEVARISRFVIKSCSLISRPVYVVLIKMRSCVLHTQLHISFFFFLRNVTFAKNDSLKIVDGYCRCLTRALIGCRAARATHSGDAIGWRKTVEQQFSLAVLPYSVRLFRFSTQRTKSIRTLRASGSAILFIYSVHPRDYTSRFYRRF